MDTTVIADTALKSENEKLKTENLLLKKEVEENKIRRAVMEAAAKLNFHDAHSAYRLSREFVTINHQGKVEGLFGESIPAILKNLAAQSPYLVSQDPAPVTPTKPDAENTLEELFGLKSNSRLANDLYKRDQTQYQRLKEQARKKGLVA